MNARNYREAAQGVERWYRTLNGRTFMFTFVNDGWWGVGETGTLRVHRQYRPCGDYFVCKTFHGVNGESGWNEWKQENCNYTLDNSHNTADNRDTNYARSEL